MNEKNQIQPFFKNLKCFTFKEVLTSNIARKSIIILLEHKTEKKCGILICDKNPFVEKEETIINCIDKAELSHLVTNDVYGNYELFLPKNLNTVKSTLIYPASKNHILKYQNQDLVIEYETAKNYKEITLAYINNQAFDLKWVFNVLDKKSEAERIVLEDKDPIIGFIMAPDLKWNNVDIENLYLQVIVHRRNIRSIRDLTHEHLPLLENIRNKCSTFIEKVYGLKKNEQLMFFHYQPTYYHLHIHIINIKYEAPGFGQTSIFLNTAIENIKLMSNYYQNATLPFFCKKNTPLYLMFNNA